MVSPGWHSHDDGPRWIGLDVGGANLKIADGRGRAASEPFELWKRPGDLANAIERLLRSFDDTDHAGLAMTMTGELADCYATKAEGVRAIVAATAEATHGVPMRVAAIDDRWLTPAEAAEQPAGVAAANWRVAARLVARNRPVGAGLWIDTGSTTTDVIPIEAGRVSPAGTNDTARLRHGELVYTGVRRTPVCGLVDRLPYGGQSCPVAAEWFATTADAWLLLGEIPEDRTTTATADGRPLTRVASIDRLARCLCADRDSYTPQDARLAAEQIAACQTDRLVEVLKSRRPDWLMIGGEGEFLARRAAGLCWERIDLESVSTHVGADVSRSLPAHAAAVLASNELGALP